MEIIGCANGHFYNPELYSSCPECARKNGGGSDFLGATEPVDFGNYANNFGNVGATEPVGFGGFSGGSSDIGKTEPMGMGGFTGGGSNDIGKTEPVGMGGFVGGNSGSGFSGGSFAGGGAGGFNDMMSTTDFRDGSSSGSGSTGSSKVQDYAPTMPILPPNMAASSHGSVPFMPVVGWLVCIDGPAKGRDYRIHSQHNYIGRAQHMDICISGDDHISAENAAVITYDPEERIFYFGSGMGRNIVRLNGKMLQMNSSPILNAYDVLSIGQTRLTFIPLCGERFDWNDK